MKQYKKIVFIATLMFLFFSSLFASNELEVVWENNYKVKFDASASIFSFDLASKPDRILLLNNVCGSNTGLIMAPSSLSIFEIDINTGKEFKISKTGVSTTPVKLLVEKSNDTLSILCLGFFADEYVCAKMGAKINESSFDFIIHSPDDPFGNKYTEYLPGFISGSGMDHTFLCYNKDIGLRNRKFNDNGKYSVDSVTIKDTFKLVNLNEGNLFDDLETGVQFMQLYHTHIGLISTNEHILIAGLRDYFNSDIRLGFLLVRFDDSGNILSKKFVQDDGDNTELRYTHFHYANGHVYLLCEKLESDKWNGYIRKYSLDGSLVKEKSFLYMNSPVLSSYSQSTFKNHFLSRIHITEKDELYLSGSIRLAKPKAPYSLYLSKYDSDMNLLYEKRWACKNKGDVEKNCIMSDDILIKDDYVYVKSLVMKNLEKESDHLTDGLDSTVYVVKFKEPVGSIDNLTSSIDINLYPNPASFISHLSISLPFSCNLDISLCDLLGRDLFSVYSGYSDVGLFERDIVLRHLSTGVYLLKVRINDTSQIMKLIVK